MSDEYSALQLANIQLEKQFADVSKENGHLTSELLRVSEQIAEYANAEAAMAQKLADIQKQHELEAALQTAMQDPMQCASNDMRFGAGGYTPRCAPALRKIKEFQARVNYSYNSNSFFVFFFSQ